MSQKTLNLCLERYNFVKFGETTKSSHTVLCTNNAYSVNSDKYKLTPTAIASKHGEGYVFTLNYDFDRPLFTIVQKSYFLDGTSGNIVFEGIDPISKGGSKYLRKVTVSPVKLSDGSYLLEVTKDEYLRIGTTGAALGDEELESLNEKIMTDGGITKSVETVGGKQVLKLDGSGPSGKEIVYFDVDPSDPPSGIHTAIGEALSNNKLPVLKIDGAVYFYTATGTDKYVFVGGYTKDAVGYTEIEVSDDDSVTSKSVDDKVFNMYLLYRTDPASPGDPPGTGDQPGAGYWICDENKHVITKTELMAAHASCRYFVLNNDIEPDSNTRKYFASVTDISNSNIRILFSMIQTDDGSAAEFTEKLVMADSEGRLYVLRSYEIYLAGTNNAVLVSEPQNFDSTQKAQGRSNIGAASASDVTALQSQVSSLSDVSAYSVKGEATVAQLNAGPSGIQAGWAYQLTDSGTLTDGSLAVVAGDTVAWDGTKWFPLVKSDYYATKTYAESILPRYTVTSDMAASAPYNDLNTFPINSIAIVISAYASVANKPTEESFQVTTLSANGGAKTQIVTTATHRTFIRSFYTFWGDWCEIFDGRSSVRAIGAVTATMAASAPYNDLNTFPINSVAIVIAAYASVANKPTDESFQVTTLSANGGAKTQIVTTATRRTFVRSYFTSWGDWSEVLDGRNAVKSIGAVTSTMASSAPYNDLNTFPINSVAIVISAYASVANKPTDESFQVTTLSANGGAKTQIATTATYRTFVRSFYTLWSRWTEIVEPTESMPNPLMAFDNFVCIGDSLTYSSVFVDADSSHARQAKRTYPEILASICGCTQTTLARAGDSAKSSWNRWKDNLEAKTNALAIIYLGTNLGLTDTLSTDAPANEPYTEWADTNTGCYAKYVARLQELGYKVLLINVARGGGDDLATTQSVVRQIGVRFGCCVIDGYYNGNVKYHYYPDLSGTNTLHYNDLGYAWFASVLPAKVAAAAENQLKYIIPS